jgi:16S rRNA (cytosine1402-N4)-methyltransferase
MAHIPVLLNETLEYLNTQPGDTIIDCTIGGGGHAEALLEQSGPNGTLLGIDASKKAIAYLQEELKKYQKRIILAHGNFRNIKQIAYDHSVSSARGILMDLGLSSDELADPGQGFSFRVEGPLDMRFGSEGVTAAELVNSATEEELIRIIARYGEERYARRIAIAIVVARRKIRFETTTQLVDVIVGSVPKGYERGRIHPATRTFQALRIATNDELGALEAALPQAVELLEEGGRLVVISFHSLEDRIVKRFFRKHAGDTLRVLTKKPIQASEEETRANPRARSAKLRVAEKIHTHE